jgi:hypothetical protein
MEKSRSIACLACWRPPQGGQARWHRGCAPRSGHHATSRVKTSFKQRSAHRQPATGQGEVIGRVPDFVWMTTGPGGHTEGQTDSGQCPPAPKPLPNLGARWGRESVSAGPRTAFRGYRWEQFWHSGVRADEYRWGAFGGFPWRCSNVRTTDSTRGLPLGAVFSIAAFTRTRTDGGRLGASLGDVLMMVGGNGLLSC